VPAGRRGAGTPGYDALVLPPDHGHDWLGLTDGPLPIGALYEWCVRPDCGAVVLFSGTVRDHATDDAGGARDGVTHLDYEAYEEQVVPKLSDIAAECRARWPGIGRVALVHRVGRLELGESSVVVAVSAPHRPEAFAAAKFAIDALKVSVPVWKREVWAAGPDGDVVSDWGTNASDLVPAARVPHEQPQTGSGGD
jgi:molybdopterin synthase catalytic subunit